MAADEQQLVQTITERVMAQVQAQLTGMQEKITKLEQKVEAETNKRMQLEEEIRKLKEHPPYPAQKFFLRNYALGEKGEGNGIHVDPVSNTRNSRTQSDVSGFHPELLFSSANTQSVSTQPETASKTKTYEGKSEWKKAPLPSDAAKGGDSAVFDTVLFDTASDRTVREGCLEKMGKNRPSWKVRFFRLQQGNLFYYKTPKDKKPIGDIPLQNCSIFRSNTKRSFEFTISLPSRDWLFVAKDEEEAQQWVDALTSCSTKATIYYQ